METQRFWIQSLYEHQQDVREGAERARKPFIIFPNGGERRPQHVKLVYRDSDYIMFERSIGDYGTHPGLAKVNLVEDIFMRHYNDNIFQHKYTQCLRAHVRPLILTRGGYPRTLPELDMNANIARLGLLKRLFPDAVILVPFRHPVDHAASMLRQHRNFLSRHAEDPFSRKYMHDIGHFEFGTLHRPIRFNTGPDSCMSREQPDTLDYWLAYWIEAFEHVEQQQQHVMLLSYEQACSDGSTTLATLGNRIDPGFNNPPETLAGIFRPPPGYDKAAEVRNNSLLDHALALHQRLLDMSIV